MRWGLTMGADRVHLTSSLSLPLCPQGPLLEEEGKQIGIVTAIAAPAALRVHFSGDGGHAGALLMPYRNDAGLAAAELALFVEKTVLDTGAPLCCCSGFPDCFFCLLVLLLSLEKTMLGAGARVRHCGSTFLVCCCCFFFCCCWVVASAVSVPVCMPPDARQAPLTPCLHCPDHA